MRDDGAHIGPTTPVGEAASLILRQRLRRVWKLLRRIEKRKRPAERVVHRLRVSTRRAASAIHAFEDCLDAACREHMLAKLKRIRRAAGGRRDADVQRRLLDEIAGSLGTPVGVAKIRKALDHEALEARPFVRTGRKGIKRRSRELIASITGPGSMTLREAARRPLKLAAEAVSASAAGAMHEAQALHKTRIAVKRLRYLLEVLEPACRNEAGNLIDELTHAQDELGRANDIRMLSDRVSKMAETDEGLAEPAAALQRLSQEEALRAASKWRDRLVSLPSQVAILTEVIVIDSRTPHARTQVTQAMLETAAQTNGQGGWSLASPIRIAAIDVGSNSIRLIVAEADPDGSYVVLDDERDVARLAAGLETRGEILEESAERATRAIGRMRRIAEGYGASLVRAVATSAVRDARNGAAFAARVSREIGIELEVISPEEEARLAWKSASRAFDLESGRVAVADIGGGSVQVVLAAEGVVERLHLLRLGAVRMTTRFGGGEPASGERYEEMRSFIRAAIARDIGEPPFVPQFLIGTGGTFTTLGLMDLHARKRRRMPETVPTQGHELQRASLRHLLERIRKTPIRDRASIPGLPAERADIIVAGLTAADCLLEHLGVNVVRVHDRGIRDGLLLEMVETIFPRASDERSERDPMRSVRRFARRCRYEEAHAEHVTRLALSIFDDLAKIRSSWVGLEVIGERARTLLEAAGVLHDVGYLVNYDKHHLHTYHLIMHADLDGFTKREIAVIANVARYHRKSPPKKKHAAFAALAQHDRELVRTLAAILRVADGLDRTHAQTARRVSLSIKDHEARFTVEAAESIDAEIWGAQRKSDLFATAFRLRPRFVVRTVHDAHDTPTSGRLPSAETIRR